MTVCSDLISSWPVVSSILLGYLVLEMIFSIAFYRIFVPRCNRLTEPIEYRGYGRHNRHKLLLRLLRRMERTSHCTGTPFLQTLASFLREYFHHERNVHGQHGSQSGAAAWKTNVQQVPSKSSSTQQAAGQETGNNGDRSSSNMEFCKSSLPRKSDMDSLLSWAFFGKDHSHLLPWMVADLDRMYAILKDHGVCFSPGHTPGVRPMRLSLDPVEPSYRPLLFYLWFAAVSLGANVLLRLIGFRHYTTQSGLRYWYRGRSMGEDDCRNSNDKEEQQLLPLLFFHGIAPGGVALYLPMVLRGFGHDGRPLFLFENPPISSQICFRGTDEPDTVHGVQEAINTHLGQDAVVSVLAHSFGSCQATWLVNSSLFSHRIRRLVLIDPVSILLSEPDVMKNFCYARHHGYKSSGVVSVVASELFTEHYLRRQFAWYNSELWLDDIPDQTCQTLICLSQNDAILNAHKIRREVEMYMNNSNGGGSVKGGSSSNIELIVWDGADHGHCVPSSETWKQMRSVMRKQEQLILKEQSLEKSQ